MTNTRQVFLSKSFKLHKVAQTLFSIKFDKKDKAIQNTFKMMEFKGQYQNNSLQFFTIIIRIEFECMKSEVLKSQTLLFGGTSAHDIPNTLGNNVIYSRKSTLGIDEISIHKHLQYNRTQ